MVCSCVLYDDEITIYYAKLFLPFSSKISLPKQSSTVVIITGKSLSLVYGGPEGTLMIKIRNKHYFAGSFPLYFVQNIFLN